MTPVKFERQWSHFFVGLTGQNKSKSELLFRHGQKNVTPLKCELHWSHIFWQDLWKTSKKYDASEVRTSVESSFLLG